MQDKPMSKMGQDALECLRRAVRDEYERKAKLGYHVVIQIDGKTCRIPASQALQMLKDKDSK
ncbi:MAG: hypothetical protein JXM68_10480 [Sedimentisphaerales bacterium]|nr:hypothetical protein [Sedimentisphaerales bacterium]